MRLNFLACFIVVFIQLHGVSAWFELNLFKDRSSYWDLVSATSHSGKALTERSLGSCHFMNREVSKSSLDSVSIWNKICDVDHDIVEAIAFYGTRKCDTPTKAGGRKGKPQLPVMVIVLPANQLLGLHAVDLSGDAFSTVLSAAYKSLKPTEEQKPGGLLSADYLQGDLSDTVIVWDQEKKAPLPPYRGRFQYDNPGQWERLDNPKAIQAYMRLVTEKFLKKDFKNDPKAKQKAAEFETELKPYLNRDNCLDKTKPVEMALRPHPDVPKVFKLEKDHIMPSTPQLNNQNIWENKVTRKEWDLDPLSRLGNEKDVNVLQEAVSSYDPSYDPFFDDAGWIPDFTARTIGHKKLKGGTGDGDSIKSKRVKNRVTDNKEPFTFDSDKQSNAYDDGNQDFGNNINDGDHDYETYFSSHM